MTRAQMLAEFLQEGAGLPHRYGVRDCALWACDWIVRVRGVDPAAHLRGTYGTRRECERLLVSAGGLMALADECFARVGIARAAGAPQAGDVGCIASPLGPALAVRSSVGWAWKGDGFNTIGDFGTMRAWTI